MDKFSSYFHEISEISLGILTVIQRVSVLYLTPALTFQPSRTYLSAWGQPVSKPNSMPSQFSKPSWHRNRHLGRGWCWECALGMSVCCRADSCHGRGDQVLKDKGQCEREPCALGLFIHVEKRASRKRCEETWKSLKPRKKGCLKGSHIASSLGPRGPGERLLGWSWWGQLSCQCLLLGYWWLNETKDDNLKIEGLKVTMNELYKVIILYILLEYSASFYFVLLICVGQDWAHCQRNLDRYFSAFFCVAIAYTA